MQQANVPAATYSMNLPIQANQFPMTTIPSVQVQNPAYTKSSGLPATAPTQSILSNVPAGMRLNQPNIQQSYCFLITFSLNKKEVHAGQF